MLPSILVANRGEIAVRILYACRELGVRGIAIYSQDDSDAMHVRIADEAVNIGSGSLAETYLNGTRIVAAAVSVGAAAVHPGYGFLSEHAEFCRQVVDAGLVFVGPPAGAMETMGNKTTARAVAERCGASPVPGTVGSITSVNELISFADEAGYPVLIKAAFGGGGRGMRVVDGSAEASEALAAAQNEAEAAFGRAEVYVERYLRRPRHIEIQILADSLGTVVVCGTRDCSVQRRHQKLLEEAPASGLPETLVAEMCEAAKRLGREVGYVGAGTVEFLVEEGRFYFLEMNTRIQVEHPVTEEVAGVDLVAEQIRIASGMPIRVTEADMRPRGHALELRINAEELVDGVFIPSPGRIEGLSAPHMPGVRWDSGYETGDVVSGAFDSLIGKLVVWGVDRASALQRARTAVLATRIAGVGTTLPVLLHVLSQDDFTDQRVWTRWLEEVGLSSVPASADWGAGSVAAEDNTANTGDSRELATPDSEIWIGTRSYVVPPLLSRRTVLDGMVGRRSIISDRPRLVQSARRGVDRPPQSVEVRDIADAIVCPMQGTVVAIHVEPGGSVVRDEVIMILEAMKMQNPIRATRDGTVREVCASVGTIARRGDVLLTIDES